MQTTIEVKPIETKEIKEMTTNAKQTLTTCQNLKIKGQEEYSYAGECLKQVKSKIANLEDKRKEITRPLDAAKKAVMDLFRKPLDMLSEAECIIKRGLLTYQQEQEKIRREEEAKLQAQARKEEERKRQALAERARKAEAEGKTAKAEELRQKEIAVFVPVPVVPNQVEKVGGISTKTIWKFKIVDPNSIPREYLIPNDVMLGNIARATKGTLTIPGIEIYSEDVIASGR